jgi:hypothetical protein
VTFKSWLTHIVREQFGTPTALANALDMTLISFNRGLEAGTFSVSNLLRLAEITNTPAGTVLRLAGKPEVAALLERLYGITSEELSPEEQRHLSMWRKASPTARASIDVLLEYLSDANQDNPGHLTPSRKKTLQSVGVGYGKKI